MCKDHPYIYPKKGAILSGSNMDIIILNPNSSFKITTKTQHSRSDTNVLESMTGKVKVEVIIAGGRIIWENDELKVLPGSGKYMEIPPYGYTFDGFDKADTKYLSSLQAAKLQAEELLAEEDHQAATYQARRYSLALRHQGGQLQRGLEDSQRHWW